MSYLVKVAENDNAILKIFQDEDASNPRTDWDNFGHMICFHSRYNLGDKHSYSEPREFLGDLAYSLYHENKIDEYINNKADDFFRDFSVGQDEDGDWIILAEDGEEYEYNRYYDTEKEALEALDTIIEEWKNNWITEYAEDEDLREVVEENIVILPLYLYDHSGITMNTRGFSCPWDSGQVGWIYATHEEIIKEYGRLDIEKATNLLVGEVETYDQYIKGEVYGFVIEKKIKCECCHSVEYEHVDSCWGFYSLDLDENGMLDHIDKEYHELVEKLDWAS